ncbi:MAG: ABC transporter permease [Clostridiales bacterium]|nr:ABC transporter permease [Clostridiales bacterium]
MRKAVQRVYTILVMAFLYIPIAVLIVNSFNSSKSRTVWTGFTLDWYKRLFTNETIRSSLGNTILVALIASVIATVIGTLAAIGIYSMKSWAKALVINITYLPMLNPDIITGVSLMLLFVSMNVSFGYATLIMSHITFCIPYVILNVLPKLRQMNRYLYEAALDLGCSPVQAFTKVVIPEILPGILTGFLMSLTYSIDDFVVSYFTYGPTSQTLSITIYSMTRRKVSPEINALSAIIFVVVLTVLLIVNFAGNRDERREKQRERAKRREIRASAEGGAKK